jgi:hypothetical protein
MINTIEHAIAHNTLLDIKERNEEKYRPKTGWNVINKMPRIKIGSLIDYVESNEVKNLINKK